MSLGMLELSVEPNRHEGLGVQEHVWRLLNIQNKVLVCRCKAQGKKGIELKGKVKRF